MAVQAGLCLTWSETPKTGFLMVTKLKCPFSAGNIPGLCKEKSQYPHYRTVVTNDWCITYEGCSEIIETISILSNGLKIIQNNLHSATYMGSWTDSLTASFNRYDPIAFLRLIPHYLGACPIVLTLHCTVSLIYYHLNEQATINCFASKVPLYQ